MLVDAWLDGQKLMVVLYTGSLGGMRINDLPVAFAEVHPFKLDLTD